MGARFTLTCVQSAPSAMPAIPGACRPEAATEQQQRFPSADRQRNRFDLYTTARSDQNGHFTFRGVPPGDYKLFAWEALEQFAYYDPDVMRVYEARGKLLHVSESSTQTAEVRIIPPLEP